MLFSEIASISDIFIILLVFLMREKYTLYVMFMYTLNVFEICFRVWWVGPKFLRTSILFSKFVQFSRTWTFEEHLDRHFLLKYACNKEKGYINDDGPYATLILIHKYIIIRYSLVCMKHWIYLFNTYIKWSSCLLEFCIFFLFHHAKWNIPMILDQVELDLVWLGESVNFH